MWHIAALILACPLNMQPGALQVLAALLHGVQTLHTNDTRQLTVYGSLDLTAIQVRKANAAFHKALLPHELWVGSLPVCLAEYHEGKVRRLRLVLATQSHLLTAEASSLQEGLYLAGRTAAHGSFVGCSRCLSNTRMAGHPRRATVRVLETPAQ